MRMQNVHGTGALMAAVSTYRAGARRCVADAGLRVCLHACVLLACMHVLCACVSCVQCVGLFVWEQLVVIAYRCACNVL